ncbi:hypothetical protein EDB81DRAFT_775415 [Dactylonectria macrodidyma]|uniref:Secreted protein n=1 Tax=Dactylonectria macrodidyma TaxID=307937 RepID=A0A9P9FNY8_9HYPO|nr:hypothetical protein EDB81DRAFT_775415 [Dactylonectria macrodidyma]
MRPLFFFFFFFFLNVSFVESAAGPRRIDCASSPHEKRWFCPMGYWSGWDGTVVDRHGWAGIGLAEIGVGHLEFWDTRMEGENGRMAMAARASCSRDHSNSHD